MVLLAALFVAYVVLSTISGLTKVKLFAGKRLAQRERIGLYFSSMLTAWVAALLLGGVAIAAGFSPADLGLALPSPGRFGAAPLVAVLAIVACAALVAVLLVETARLARNPAYRERVWVELAAPPAPDGGNGAAPDDGYQPARDLTLELLAPRTLPERRVFYGICVTAGLCEELLFRGIAFALVEKLFPGGGLIAMVVLSSCVFAIGHAYQGWEGIAKTGVIGLVFGGLYAATGSLIPGMVLHAVFDLRNAYLVPLSPPVPRPAA